MGPDDEDLPNEEAEDENEGEDAGLGDDESGDEAEAGQEPEDAETEEGAVDEPPAKVESRASKAVREAKNLAKANAEKAARFERELTEARAQIERSKPQGETPEQEAARMSLMTAEERMDYKLAKAEEKHQRQIAMVQFQAADNADKAAYDAKASSDPRYKKYAPEVEKLLAEERRQGRSFPRETILKFVLGDRVMNGKKEVEKQRTNGQRNIQRAQTQPSNSRSDRAAPRGRLGTGNTLADLEKRLEGVEI